MKKLFVAFLLGLTCMCITITSCQQKSEEVTPPAEEEVVAPAEEAAPPAPETAPPAE